MPGVTTDFDGAWKEALERYLPAFLALCFPQAHADIAWSQGVQFLETELQQIAPAEDQGKQRVDKLVRVVRRSGAEAWVLIHVEVQSQRDAAFAERMFRYHARIYDRYRRQVVSLAVLGDDDPDWRPQAFGYALWDCVLGLQFPTVKLTALDGAQLEASDNLFATVILLHRDALAMRGNTAARIGQRVARYRRVLERGYAADDIRALLGLLDRVLRVPAAVRDAALAAMRQVEEEFAVTYMTSYEEVGREKGLEQGRAEGRVEAARVLVLRIATKRFGTLEAELTAQIAALPSERLDELALALLDFANLEELRAWLAAPPA
jgi:hypothetical protein